MLRVLERIGVHALHQLVDRKRGLPGFEQVVKPANLGAAAPGQVGQAGVQLAFALRLHALQKPRRGVGFCEAVAIGVLTFGEQHAGLNQGTQRRKQPRRIRCLGERWIILDRETRGIGQRQRLGQLARVRRKIGQTRLEHRRHRAREIRFGELARKQPGGGLEARDAGFDQVPEQLHRVPRVAAGDLVNSRGDTHYVLDVAEHASDELFGLCLRQRLEPEGRAEPAQHVAGQSVARVTFERYRDDQAPPIDLVSEHGQQRGRRFVDLFDVIDGQHQPMVSRQSQQPIPQGGLNVPALRGSRRIARLPQLGSRCPRIDRSCTPIGAAFFGRFGQS